MTQFSQDSPEYMSNGHYRINGKDFMSVWTFKKSHGFSREQNTTPINGREGKELAQICSEVYSTKPDFGGFSEILVFPVSELENYFKS